MATEIGGYFRNIAVDSPGNAGRKPCFSAVASVERAGENRAP